MRGLFFVCFVNKNSNYFICTDSAEYTAIAENLYKNFANKKIDGDYNFRRLPGYPMFLAVGYKIFGDADIKKTLWAQVFLSCFIPILIFFLSS